MNGIPRTDTSLFGAWWWTVDRWLLAALLILLAGGLVFVFAASPPVAERIGLDPFHFVARHMALMPLALLLLVGASFLAPRGVRRVAIAVLGAGLALMVLTLFVGDQVKGAHRWLNVMGFSLQASEFVKPALIVVTAWLLAAGRDQATGSRALSILLLATVVGLLLLQPDFGMAVTVVLVWATQYFIAGLSVAWIAVLAALGTAIVVGGYMLLPHVRGRIDRFFDGGPGDTYQIDLSLDGFAGGGLFGRGPGEGTVKAQLPDAHADFIFAVIGEEFGLIICLVIVGLFAFVVLRGLARAAANEDLFVLLAACGLLVQFGLQAFINMAVALDLAPTKGMTLPFISYGGSSLLALALGMGMALALTRRGAAARTSWT